MISFRDFKSGDIVECELDDDYEYFLILKRLTIGYSVYSFEYGKYYKLFWFTQFDKKHALEENYVPAHSYENIRKVQIFELMRF